MSVTHLTHEKYGGRPVVIINGYKYYVISKHRTKFNANRQLRKLDYPAKVRKADKWWVIVRALPKQFQEKRRLL